MNIPVKTVLIISLLGATQCACASGFDGFISGALGNLKSSGSADQDGSVQSLAVSAAYTDTSKFGGQFDYVDFRHAPKAPYQKTTTSDMAGHIFFRESSWLAGVLVQKREFNVTNFSTSINEDFQAIEGQLYLADMVLNGQLGKETWTNGGTETKGNFVATHLAYFVNDNLLVSGGIDLLRENTNGYSYDQNNYKLGIEGRLTNIPLSIFAEYLRIDEKDNASWNANTDIFMVGVKFHFGKSTLRSSRTEGAGLMPAPRVLYFSPAIF